jgi:hypothetical protein
MVKSDPIRDYNDFAQGNDHDNDLNRDCNWTDTDGQP